MKNNLDIPIQSLALQLAVMAGFYERRKLHPVVIAAAEGVGWSNLSLHDVAAKEEFRKHYRKAVKEYRQAQQDNLDGIRKIIGSET